jgi:hypothetical protein
MRLIVGAIIALSSGQVMAQDVNWTRVSDHTEHAFSVDAPTGWKVNGGVIRRSPMQPHIVIQIESPGGATRFILGNIDAISYSILTPLSYQLGFREGQIHSAGADIGMVLNYRTGQQWAVSYGQKLLTGAQNIRLLGNRDQTAMLPRLPPAFPPFHASAGDAFFTAEREGHTYEVYVFAKTEITGDQNTAVWNADNTFAFSTPKGHGMAAGLVVTHIVQSLRIDPQWLTKQLQVSGKLAQDALDAANASLSNNTAMMDKTFSSPSQTQRDARASQEEIGRLISGFDTYKTESGDTKTVPYAAATDWWSNSRGQTLGTQGPSAPGPSWNHMQRVNPTGE